MDRGIPEMDTTMTLPTYARTSPFRMSRTTAPNWDDRQRAARNQQEPVRVSLTTVPIRVSARAASTS